MNRVGFGVWPGMPISDAITAVRKAEKQGFESAWVVESSLTPGKDAISYLGALAVTTERIQLASGVINPFSRSPTLIASTMATLDEMSKGRMILGLGTGHVVIAPFHSVAFHDPLERVREYVEVFRRLIAGNAVNYEGKHVHIKNLKLNLQPHRKRIPVYLAAVSERLAKVAGEIADGVLFVLVTPSRVTQLVSALREGAKVAGLASDSLDVASYLPAFVMEDREKAMMAARQTVAGYARSIFYRRLYRRMGFRKEADSLKEAWEKAGMEEAIGCVPDRMAKELVLVGSAEECLKRVEEYRRAGVGLPVIQPFYSPVDPESNVNLCLRIFGA